jgi:NAD(P)-dependent dehydrogenase (short-subunit alcohol dehydrogenase family)
MKSSEKKESVVGKLKGKVAVITGGSSGIGLETAKRFVEEGAYVFITGRRASELEKARSAIGRNVTVVQGDVANLADLDRLWATVQAEKGGVDIIVASAGFVETITLAQATPDHFDKTFGINARGTFFTVQKALPLLRNNGSIVLVSSCVANMGIPMYTTYGATKAAIRSFARSWAMELKERGVRVNTLSPGATDTPILDGQFKTKEEVAGAKKMFAEKTPLGRIGRPEELAAAALFLASDDSSYATGIDLVVDGGMTQV